MSIAVKSLSFVSCAAAGGFLAGVCAHKIRATGQIRNRRFQSRYMQEGRSSLVASVLSSVSFILGSKLVERLTEGQCTNRFAIAVIKYISYQALFNQFYSKHKRYSWEVIISGAISSCFFVKNLNAHQDLLNRLDTVIGDLLSGSENKFSVYHQSLSYLAVPIGVFAGGILTQSLINFCNNKNLKKPLNRGYEYKSDIKYFALGVLALASSTYVYKSPIVASATIGGLVVSYLFRQTSARSTSVAFFSTIVVAKYLDGSLRSEFLSFQGASWGLSKEAIKVFYFISNVGMGAALAFRFILPPGDEHHMKQRINRGYLAGTVVAMAALRILKGSFPQPPAKIFVVSMTSYYLIGRPMLFWRYGR